MKYILFKKTISRWPCDDYIENKLGKDIWWLIDNQLVNELWTIGIAVFSSRVMGIIEEEIKEPQ